MNATESKIVRQVIADLLNARYEVSVYDAEGCDYLIRRSSDATAIYAAMGQLSDGDMLHVGNHCVGGASYVHFIYGNDCDVIHDYGDSLRHVLARSFRVAERLANEAQ